VYMVSTAFKPLDELFLWPPRFFVQRPVLDNFQGLVAATSALQVPFTRYIFNSGLVACASVGGIIVLSSLGAYPLAKHKSMPARNTIFTLIVAALMFAPEVTQIPRYVVVDALGLIDTYWALILPQLASAYALFLMKQFMEQIPDELLEAARIDGAGEFRIFWTIAMPLATPVLATLGILTFLGSWNGFIYPLVMAQEPDMYTLPVALATFATGQFQADHGMLMAGSVILVVPVLLIFIVVQRWVTEGIATTGLKG